MMIPSYKENHLIGSSLASCNDESQFHPRRRPFSGPPAPIPLEVSMQPMHNIPARGALNFDETPFLAIWEITQSCDLACKHCRAAAQPIAHPDELTNAEGKALIDQIADMGVPIFVFTGGDPLKRKDVFELIRYAADKGVQVALTPQRHAAAHPRGHLQAQRGRPGPPRHLARRLDPRDSRHLPRPARRLCPHHPGHRMGQRSRHPHPGPHHHQPPQRQRS